MLSECLSGIVADMASISQYLEAASLTQAAFAQQLGVTQGTVSKWKAGEKRPGLDMALKIEAATSGAVPVASWVQHKSTSCRKAGDIPGGIQSPERIKPNDGASA